MEYEHVARLENIESHLKALKTSSETRCDDIRMIKTALIGDELNQETGLVHRIKKIDERVEALQVNDHKNSVYINQLKFVVGIIMTLIVGFIFSIILK